MASYPDGAIPVTGVLGTTDPTDTYPVYTDELMEGGLHTVADGATRDAIPTLRRKFGMLVTLQDSTVTSILANAAMGGTDSDLSNNANWIDYTAGGGSLAIGDAVTGGSPNRVLYIDGASALAVDNPFQYDDSTGFMSIGQVLAPDAKLDVGGIDSDNYMKLLRSYSVDSDEFFIQVGDSNTSNVYGNTRFLINPADGFAMQGVDSSGNLTTQFSVSSYNGSLYSQVFDGSDGSYGQLLITAGNTVIDQFSGTLGTNGSFQLRTDPISGAINEAYFGNQQVKISLLSGSGDQILGVNNDGVVGVASAGLITNIYNSDGVLTGPRIVDGSNNDLSFNSMGAYTINTVDHFTVSGGTTEINLNNGADVNLSAGSGSSLFQLNDNGSAQLSLTQELALGADPGTATQYFGSNGLGAAPTWQTLPAPATPIIDLIHTDSLASTIIGAGASTGTSSEAIYLGVNAGSGATASSQSNFIGYGAGVNASNAAQSNFIGKDAGSGATNAGDSTFIGNSAGNGASFADGSIFIGTGAGAGATNAEISIFIGETAGNTAPNASHSIFIGLAAGANDTVNNTAGANNTSILIGNYINTGGFTNSILLGSGPIAGSVANTASNEFMVAPQYTRYNFRGIPYIMPAAQASNGQVLTATAVSAGVATLGWTTVSSGSTSPGGLNTQLQYNNAGAFGGISGAVTDGTSVSLTGAHLLSPTINGAGAGLATLAYPNTALSATITFPTATGTLATLAGTETLTNKSVNGVILTSGGSATTYLNGAGAYTTPAGTVYTGTANRLTVTGAVLDIAATYVGQTSIATLGAVGTGTWQASAVGAQFGGTGQNSSASTGIAAVSGGVWAFSTALPNTTTATTQAAGNNSTSVATTAYIDGGFIPIAGRTYTTTTGNGCALTTSTLTSGTLLSLASTGTGAASNTQTILNISASGANASASQSTWGLDIANTHTGTGTNIGMRINAASGSNNYAMITTGGLVGINTSLPTSQLHMVSTSIGATPTDAQSMLLENTTAAANGAQQSSPPLVLAGKGWKTTATAASQDYRHRIYTKPVQSTTQPSGALTFETSVNGGAYTFQMNLVGESLQFNSTGSIAIGGSSALDGSKLQIPTVFGGTAVSSTLTLKSTSGVGSSDAILFLVGSNGATEGGRFLTTGVLQMSKDVKLSVAGNGLYIKEGTNATMGQATLVGGTVVVNTTKVTASSRIFLQADGGTLTNIGFQYVSARTAGTSFTITSVNILDTSNVDWMIVEPA